MPKLGGPDVFLKSVKALACDAPSCIWPKALDRRRHTHAEHNDPSLRRPPASSPSPLVGLATPHRPLKQQAPPPCAPAEEAVSTSGDRKLTEKQSIKLRYLGTFPMATQPIGGKKQIPPSTSKQAKPKQNMLRHREGQMWGCACRRARVKSEVFDASVWHGASPGASATTVQSPRARLCEWKCQGSKCRRLLVRNQLFPMWLPQSL